LADEISDELKQKVMDYLKTVSKAKNKEVAKAIDEDKHLVDKAIAALSKEDLHEITGNLTGFFAVLSQWARAEKEQTFPACIPSSKP
jgi:hypothetical protein